jgi:CBS domain-containing protein
MLVKEIMKEAVCVTAGETLEIVARRLKNDNVGCLPVCEGKQGAWHDYGSRYPDAVRSQ